MSSRKDAYAVGFVSGSEAAKRLATDMGIREARDLWRLMTPLDVAVSHNFMDQAPEFRSGYISGGKDWLYRDSTRLIQRPNGRWCWEKTA